MKKYTHVIIVDEDNKPMAWSNNQLCYCTNEDWIDEPHPVKIYTKQSANKLIARTVKNRKEWKMTPGIYKTMPINYNP